MIRFIATLILFAAATSPADTLQEAVASRRPRLQDPAEILAELTVPAPVAVTNQVVTVKPAEQLAWEQAVLADMERMQELLTGSKTNAVASLTRSTSVQRAQAMRAAKAGNPNKAAELANLSDALMDHRNEAKERGLWPIGPDFGQATTTNNVVTAQPGPAWWQREGLPRPPTIGEIIHLME